MKKKTWKTGPFIQDNEAERVLASDYHFRCIICDYSNMSYHDENLIALNGPKRDRQMYSNEQGDIVCYECINKEQNFGFKSFEDMTQKRSEWKPLKRPHGEKDIPIFDKSSFYLEKTSTEYKEDEWDALEKYNAEMQEEYWEEILKQEGLEKID
jgi:hypothetical protein